MTTPGHGPPAIHRRIERTGDGTYRAPPPAATRGHRPRPCGPLTIRLRPAGRPPLPDAAHHPRPPGAVDVPGVDGVMMSSVPRISGGAREEPRNRGERPERVVGLNEWPPRR